MPVKTSKRAKQLRCYKCGHDDVISMCHHCGRAMCEQHQPVIKNKKGKLISQEFTKLGLKGTNGGEAVYHCKFCKHTIRMPYWYLSLLVISLIFFLKNNIQNDLLLNSLIFIIVALLFTVARRIIDIIVHHPPMPLNHRFETIQMREKIKGEISLDAQGNCQVTTSPLDAELFVKINWGAPENERVRKYYRKYWLFRLANRIRIHAGFISFKEPVDIKISGPNIKRRGTVIPLIGCYKMKPQLIYNYIDLKNLQFKFNYELYKQPAPDSFPIRLFPALRPFSDQKVLELEVQWGPFTLPTKNLEFKQIDELRLQVPESWGIAESEGIIIKPREFVWRKPVIGKKAYQEHRYVFHLKFDNPIQVLDTIRGQIKATFKNSHSKIQNMVYFYPVGTKSKDNFNDIETNVETDFILNLSSLYHQSIRLIPLNERNNGREKILTFHGVIPDYDTIAELILALNDDGNYVQRVFEELPRTGRQANQIIHAWDIAGRYYDGVFPIDFHILINGEEIYETELRPEVGKTTAIVKVKGMYIDQKREMKIEIEEQWEKIYAVVKNVLQTL